MTRCRFDFLVLLFEGLVLESFKISALNRLDKVAFVLGLHVTSFNEEFATRSDCSPPVFIVMIFENKCLEDLGTRFFAYSWKNGPRIYP